MNTASLAGVGPAVCQAAAAAACHSAAIEARWAG